MKKILNRLEEEGSGNTFLWERKFQYIVEYFRHFSEVC
jgi:hypothetical protein